MNEIRFRPMTQAGFDVFEEASKLLAVLLASGAAPSWTEALRERGYARFREVFQELGGRARDEQPELPPLDDIVPRVLVLAITERVGEEVRGGRIQQLPGLEEDIVLIAAKLLADDRTARGLSGGIAATP
jgi:hypothetical protein